MRWTRTTKFDHRARVLADRHYSRQKPGSPQFAPPGRTVVLRIEDKALWVSLAQEYDKHAWPGAWVCSLFRNEGAGLSSELITEAVAATAAAWGTPPEHGFLTYVNERRVRSSNPGCCFRYAGWEVLGRSRKRGLLALQLRPDAFPAPVAAPRLQRSMLEVA